MKFFNLSETVADVEVLKGDYKTAWKIGRAAVGADFFYFKRGLTVYYIPYGEIYRAFRRIKGVPARICCGRGEIRLEFLVICSKKDEIAEIDLPNEQSSTAIIEEIQKKNPSVKIGKKS